MAENYWTTRWSRRRFGTATIAAGAGLLGLGLVGCGDDDSKSQSTSTPASGAGSATASTSASVRSGGTLKYGGPINKLTVLDPHQNNNAEVTTPAGLTYLTLLRTGAQADGNKILPGAIEKWEQPDDTTYVLTLRQGMKMQNVKPLNGRAVTTDDVLYLFKRIQTNDPKFYLRSLFSPISSVEATDGKTVTIKTSEPYASLPAWLALPHSVMIPKEMDDAHPDGLGGVGAGAGPFIMEKFAYEGGARFVKNPDYFEGSPALDAIEMAPISDQNAHLAAVTAKSIDISSGSAGTYLSKRQYDDLKSRAAKDYTFQEWPFPSWTSVRFNVAKAPFKDERIRKALALATDRAAYSNLGYEGGLVQMGPLSAALPNWAIPADQLKQKPGYRTPKDQDIADAKALLKAAGAENLSFTIGSLNGQPYESAVQTLANTWKQSLGIDVKIQLPPDYTALIDQLNKHNFEAFHMFHSGYLDPDDYFISHHTSKGARNYGQINDQKVDDLALRVRGAIKPEQRKQLSDELQDYLLQQNYFIYLGNPLDYYANNPKVKGWFHEAVTNGEWRWAGSWGFSA